MPAGLERRISLLLSHLRRRRSLVVLDNLETLLEEGDATGRYRPGYEGYGRLLRRVAETAHRSCLLITSREKPATLVPLEGIRSPVRTLRLCGLDALACQELLADNGEIGQFLSGSEVIFGSIQDLLAEQFARLSALERTVLLWLAIVREPVTIQESHRTSDDISLSFASHRFTSKGHVSRGTGGVARIDPPGVNWQLAKGVRSASFVRGVIPMCVHTKMHSVVHHWGARCAPQWCTTERILV